MKCIRGEGKIPDIPKEIASEGNDEPKMVCAFKLETNFVLAVYFHITTGKW